MNESAIRNSIFIVTFGLHYRYRKKWLLYEKVLCFFLVIYYTRENAQLFISQHASQYMDMDGHLMITLSTLTLYINLDITI